MRRASLLAPALLLLVRVSTFSSDSQSETGHLASFDFDDLQALTWETRARLFYALRTEGAIFIRGLPGYSDTVVEALDAFDLCLHRLNAERSHSSATTLDGVVHRTFPDGVERLSVATATEGGNQRSLPASVTAACPSFDKPFARLRSLVSILVELVARGIDSATQVTVANDKLSVERLVRSGIRLEQLHHYTKADEEYNSHLGAPTLRMHTDVGLFQALAVRWRVSNALADGSADEVGVADAFDHGLDIQLPNGDVVHAKAQASQTTGSDGVGLLIVAGQGLASWFPHLQLRPAPHSLSFPRSARSLDRLVYGVMVLPHKDWLLPTSGGSSTQVAFGEWWNRARHIVLGNVSSQTSGGDGCLAVDELSRRLEDQADTCGVGEVWCWMQCAPVPADCGHEEAQCISEHTGGICPPGPFDDDHIHDATCAPRCPSEVVSTNASGRTAYDFCTGMLTDMHMTGFVWSDPDNACLIFLFQGLELTDEGKFWAAAIVTVAAGVLAEFMVYYRRHYMSRRLRRFGSTKRDVAVALAERAGRVSLYACSRALGYFIMLVSMTYSAELFISVLVGLTIGYSMFNINAPTGDDLTACCQSQADADRFQTNVSSEDMTIPSLPDGTSAVSRANFKVSGMSCKACVETVRRATESLDGTHVVELNLSSSHMQVEFNDFLAQDCYEEKLRSVCSAVEDVGFSVTHVTLGAKP